MSSIFKAELDDKKLEELFNSEEKCYEFLAELKWSNGFTCRKCGNTNYCLEKLLIQDGAQNAKQKNPLQPVQFFTTANFRSAKPFILLIMFARGKRIFQHMNLPGGCRSVR